MELTVAHDNLIKTHEEEKSEKEAQVTELNNEISNLKTEFEQFKDEKDNEIHTLNDKIQSQETSFNEQVALKDATIAEAEANIQKLKDDLEKLQQQKLKEKEDMDNIMSERERERQVRNTVPLSEMCVDITSFGHLVYVVAGHCVCVCCTTISIDNVSNKLWGNTLWLRSFLIFYSAKTILLLK